MQDIKLDLKRVCVYTNNSHTVLGFGAHNISTPITLLHTLGTRLSSESCSISALVKIENVKQLASVTCDIKKLLQDTQEAIKKSRDDIKAKVRIEKAISKLDVFRSDRTVEEIYESISRGPRSEREIVWPSFENTKVSPEGIIQFPRGTEPFFYNTEDDLVPFKVGDVVEVKFGTGTKTWARHKGKKLKMVVNNCLPYTYGSKSNKLALTPTEDGWSKSDIVFIDSTDRFECMMIDLFTVNRIPFRGWKTKKVSIKKVGHVDTLPKLAHSIKNLTPEQLIGKKPTEWVMLYHREAKGCGDHTHVVDKVAKLRDVKFPHLSNAYKITTTTDRHLAIDFLKNQISGIERSIEELEEKTGYYQECLIFAQKARAELFPKDPANEG